MRDMSALINEHLQRGKIAVAQYLHELESIDINALEEMTHD